VRFCFKEHCFKPVAPSSDKDSPTFELKGNLVHKDSEEGRALLVQDGGKEPKKKLKSSFSFISRASQTPVNPPRSLASQTEPQAPLVNFSDTANQWTIYDFYQEELQRQKNENKVKEEFKVATVGGTHGDPQRLKEQTEEMTGIMGKGAEGVQAIEEIDLFTLSTAVKLVENAVNQSINADIIADFKNFEDPADEFREQKGTLLPLWLFHYNTVETLPVSALCWNKEYNDLFAVGLGSNKCSNQEQGLLLLYTWRNSSFPEFIFNLDSGVMCIDIHDQHEHLSHLVAVGLVDGRVCVYNLMEKTNQPIYDSVSDPGKHAGAVWQVKWRKKDWDGNHNFFSVSGDGHVVSWTLGKYGLVSTVIIQLPAIDSVPDDLKHAIATAGFSLDFHKQKPYQYLVGSEAGKIQKCSIHHTRILKIYEGHFMIVSRVRWNPFHPKVFISSGFDWMVNVWDETINSPVFSFNLKSSVMDVAWAPFSSTVFAAVTADGKIHVFDLSVNRFEALCQQQAVCKKRQLMRIEFHPIIPIILVGDDCGLVIILKISPNLRRKQKNKKGQEEASTPEVEIAKMENLLNLAR
ncbi:hypothetical protein DNTS_028901, partial [Danionella cerebrum]